MIGLCLAWGLGMAVAASTGAATVVRATDAPRSVSDAAADVPVHQMAWRNWRVEHGLPQITISALAQDREGYLWIATQDGVARFDGVNFRRYSTLDHPGLAHNVIDALAFDEAGDLWIGTMGGLSRMRDGRIEKVEADAPTGVVSGLHPHPQGGVWVSTERGLFHAVGTRATRLNDVAGERPMVAVLQMPNGPEMAVGRAVLVEDPRGTPRLIDLSERMAMVMSAGLAPGGRLWLGTETGLHLVDRQGRILRSLAKGREILSMSPAPDGTLWLGTDRGLWRYRDGMKDAEQLEPPGFKTSEAVLRTLVDREGNLWAGTHVGGLYRGWTDRFRRITARDGLTDEAVWSVSPARDGQLWVGTPDGLYVGGLSGFRKLLGEDDGLPHPAVFAALIDRRGDRWIATYGGTAYWPKGAARPRPVPEVGIGPTSALVEDHDGDVLIGAMAGLFRYRDGTFARELLPAENGGMPVVGMAFDRAGRLWVSVNNGVVYRENGRWHKVNYTGPMRIMTFTPYGDGVLASGFDGFLYMTPTKTWPIGMAQGLHLDFVHSAQSDGRNVWYQSAHGIGQFTHAHLDALLRGERERLEVRVLGDFGSAHLAQCNGGHQNAGALTDGRWLWCPSLSGLLALDTWRLDDAAPKPPARIEAVVTPTRRIDVHTPSPARLRLEPEERDLQFDGTGLLLRTADRLTFRARLHGYDTEWRDLGSRRSAYYTNLPAGEYRYELQAINEEGRAGEPVSLHLHLQPYWHETRLARIGGVVLLLLLAWMAVRWRLRGLERQRAQLEARVHERTAELEEANRKLEEASLTDPLTGLHNRRFLGQHLPLEIARVRRLLENDPESTATLTVLHIDLDHFKHINDTYGHAVGDQVLCATADVLRENARASDFVLRWGGEEFLLIGRDNRREDLPAWAARVGRSIRERRIVTAAGPLHVTCSIGFSAYPALADQARQVDWDTVLALADAATYLAKHEGRDRQVGIALLRGDLPPDFAARLHEHAAQWEADGAIRVMRNPPGAE